jgi:hypothetical protein
MGLLAECDLAHDALRTSTMTNISMEGTDPAPGDLAPNGVLATPENRPVLYEGDTICVVSMSIAPGRLREGRTTTTSSVFVVDRLVNLTRDRSTRKESNSKQVFPTGA